MSDLLRAAAERLPGLALTYLLHSTLLIALAWLVTRLLPLKSQPLKEALWTLALFGAFGTTALRGSLDVEPLLGRLDLSRFAIAAPDASATSAGPIESTPRIAGVKRSAAARDLAPAGAPGPGRQASGAERGGSILLFVAVFALSLYGYLLLRSRLFLRDRTPLDAGPLVDALREMRVRAGFRRDVRVTVSPRLVSPVAFGLLRAEICLPERALLDLDERQQRAMLAHELAHLRRGDPLRLLCARLVETVCFFQPLNRLARRQLFEVIESRCDSFAVGELGGHGLPLAECLAEVAGWLAARPHASPVPAMAQAGSALGRRISRLLRGDEALRDERRGRSLVPFVFALLPAFALCAPFVSLARGESAGKRDARSERAPAPAERAAAGEVDAMIDEAAELLEREIGSLEQDLSEVRALLPWVPYDEEIHATLAQVEQRLDRLERRRALLTAWRSKVASRIAGTSGR